MAEKICVRQNSELETKFWAIDPHDSEVDEYHPVAHINALTPYGMLLTGLASCTAIVLHTYAQNRDIDLREVEIKLQYARDFAQDCEDCEESNKYEEYIELELKLEGELDERDRARLLRVAHHCPVHKLLKSGIKVQVKQMEEA